MITFDPSDKEHITTLLRDYLAKELGVEIGRFDAEFLMDFVTSKIGETIYALEQPTA